MSGGVNVLTVSNWITNRINELCRGKNMTINKLATISGITQSTLNSIMHGNSKRPTLATLYKLCIGLDITLSQFFQDFEKSEIDID